MGDVVTGGTGQGRECPWTTWTASCGPKILIRENFQMKKIGGILIKQTEKVGELASFK